MYDGLSKHPLEHLFVLHLLNLRYFAFPVELDPTNTVHRLIQQHSFIFVFNDLLPFTYNLWIWHRWGNVH